MDSDKRVRLLARLLEMIIISSSLEEVDLSSSAIGLLLDGPAILKDLSLTGVEARLVFALPPPLPFLLPSLEESGVDPPGPDNLVTFFLSRIEAT